MGEIGVDDGAGVRSIRLNRPAALNAITLTMIRQLDDAIRDALADESVRAILLTGNGPSFCAGDDVHAQADICAGGEAALRDQLLMLQRISENLVLGDKPVVGAIRGWAIGAGFSWVLNCDFALCSDMARGFLPEVGFGSFVTGGASWLLPKIAGERAAREMLFRGIRLKAADLLARGIASEIVADAALDEAALHLARDLAALPTTSARLMKRTLMAPDAAAFRAALAAETEACVATTLNPETLARMRAALDRKD